MHSKCKSSGVPVRARLHDAHTPTQLSGFQFYEYNRKAQNCKVFCAHALIYTAAHAENRWSGGTTTLIRVIFHEKLSLFVRKSWNISESLSKIEVNCLK